MIRTMARLKAGRTALIAPALALLASAASAMEPVRSDGMPLPQSKPDLALLYPAEPFEISLPVPRPDPQTILPRATRTVAEMYLQQTGTETGKDALYTLKNGEGPFAILECVKRVLAGFRTGLLEIHLGDGAGGAWQNGLRVGARDGK